MIDVTLIVIAKEPLAGRVKTRLCPPCSPAQAAQLAEASLCDTLQAAGHAGVRDRLLALDGRPGGWLPSGWRVVRQSAGGLADRLAGAFAAAAPGPALLIGMDTPQVTAELLAESAMTLCDPEVDAVLGRSRDGGYWSIGLRRPDPRVFSGIPMSAATTGAAQLDRLERLGLRCQRLPELLDVDTIAAARAVAADARGSRFARALAAALPTRQERSTPARPALAPAKV